MKACKHLVEWARLQTITKEQENGGALSPPSAREARSCANRMFMIGVLAQSVRI